MKIEYMKTIIIDGIEYNLTPVESRFKVGDWVVPNNGEPRVFMVKERGWPDSIISGSLGNQYVNTFTLDKQYRLWTIQDAKDGDVLYSERGAGGEFIHLVSRWKKVDGENTLCSVCTYRIEDDEIITGGLGAIWWYGVVDAFYPATKEQCNLLFTKMKEAGYEWNAEKKELKKIEQNPSWSEEDEAHLHSLITHLEQWIERNPNTTGADIQGENVAWLKSLKERYTWKPSNEQMEALWDSIPENVKEISEREMLLDSLYQNLKKLREE